MSLKLRIVWHPGSQNRRADLTPQAALPPWRCSGRHQSLLSPPFVPFESNTEQGKDVGYIGILFNCSSPKPSLPQGCAWAWGTAALPKSGPRPAVGPCRDGAGSWFPGQEPLLWNGESRRSALHRAWSHTSVTNPWGKTRRHRRKHKKRETGIKRCPLLIIPKTTLLFLLTGFSQSDQIGRRAADLPWLWGFSRRLAILRHETQPRLGSCSRHGAQASKKHPGQYFPNGMLLG